MGLSMGDHGTFSVLATSCSERKAAGSFVPIALANSGSIGLGFCQFRVFNGIFGGYAFAGTGL